MAGMRISLALFICNSLIGNASIVDLCSRDLCRVKKSIKIVLIIVLTCLVHGPWTMGRVELSNWIKEKKENRRASCPSHPIHPSHPSILPSFHPPSRSILSKKKKLGISFYRPVVFTRRRTHSLTHSLAHFSIPIHFKQDQPFRERERETKMNYLLFCFASTFPTNADQY